MHDFVLQQQCPAPDISISRAESSLIDFEQRRSLPSRLGTCRCPHLLALLPQELDLTFAKSESHGWVLRNPIHALHLSSQLDAAWLLALKDEEEPPMLYGTEQERLQAITTEGVPSAWHQWIVAQDKQNNSDGDRRQRNANEPQGKRCSLEENGDQAAGTQPAGEGETSEENVPSAPPMATNDESHTTGQSKSVAPAQELSIRSSTLLSEDELLAMHAQEEHIHRFQTGLLASRTSASQPNGNNKKRKEAQNVKSITTPPLEATISTTEQATVKTFAPPELAAATSSNRGLTSPFSKPWVRPAKQFSRADVLAWEVKRNQAQRQVALWLENYKTARRLFYRHQQRDQADTSEHFTDEVKSASHICRQFDGDDLMHCLECSFVGCYRQSDENESSNHFGEHMVSRNHNFAVSCGPRGRIFCFKCGDFVSHAVFENEKERIDLAHELPWLAWKDHPLQRSFDALRFMRIPDQGIVWRGMSATYPQLIPSEHVEAARVCRWRQCLFHGKSLELPETASDEAKLFANHQREKARTNRWQILAPIGMYNLGNSCYMTAVLQCVVHLNMIQSYFLRDIGHCHQSCRIYQERFEKKHAKGVCLACELDKLLISYYENTNGVDVQSLLNEAPLSQQLINNSSGGHDQWDGRAEKLKGQPLVASDMLTIVWKCISQMAGYEQRDAHEFLHSFFDVLGRHLRQYRVRVYNTINFPQPNNAFLSVFDAVQQDIIKGQVEGTLRSVLVCQKCGNKRAQSEPFMSISLPLSSEIKRTTSQATDNENIETISIEYCLKHFILPELLADPVDCPICKAQTPTTRQHVISRLPRILVLHLKRFDPAENRKIEEFVSFPARGLNMGPYLPHWSEISGIPDPPQDAPALQQADVSPRILYNLQSTVNHYGSLQSGHYFANINISGTWYHCNDAHVSHARQEDVIAQPSAYILFYARS